VAKTRLLIVDDAVVFRRLLSAELSSDPQLEVVGTAANGRIALARVSQVNPDVVILDVEMPEMDGLETLAQLRKSHPHLPVIMFSAFTERGAKATLDALALGASDYFTKPANGSGPEASLEVIRQQLLPRIKALAESARARAALPTPARDGPLAAPSRPRPPIKPGAIELVAIGTSTGGPNALAEVMRRLPSDFPVPVAIVQHMPPMFTRLLAERLCLESGLSVKEATAGSVLEQGTAWVAPGDYHMGVVRKAGQLRIELHQGPPENSCRPAADVLFRSVAQACGPAALAVIMTGMGQDGLRGCEAIREAGGQILAQDEATSVVWGMPGAVARAGLADRILPLAMIGDEIRRRVPQKELHASGS
jgi:two-component system chemotaxis response regulator CheB